MSVFNLQQSNFCNIYIKTNTLLRRKCGKLLRSPTRSSPSFLFMHQNTLSPSVRQLLTQELGLTGLAGGHCESRCLQQTPPDRCRCQCRLTRSGQCAKCPCYPVACVAHSPHLMLHHPSPIWTYGERVGQGLDSSHDQVYCPPWLPPASPKPRSPTSQTPNTEEI